MAATRPRKARAASIRTIAHDLIIVSGGVVNFDVSELGGLRVEARWR